MNRVPHPHSIINNSVSHVEKEDLKREAKKPGLYRFKDEVEGGDKELQLKSLNLLFKKEGFLYNLIIFLYFILN